MKVILSSFREELPIKAVVEYCKIIGQECFVYDEGSDGVYYKKKTGKPKYGAIIVTQDLGDTTTVQELVNHYNPFSLFVIDDEEFKKRRTDPILVELVEKYGDGMYLRVTEIPDDVDWYIDSDEGTEWVAENHRTWH